MGIFEIYMAKSFHQSIEIFNKLDFFQIHFDCFICFCLKMGFAETTAESTEKK